MLSGVVMLGFGVGIGVLGLSMFFEWFSWKAPKALAKVLGVVFMAGGVVLIVLGPLKMAGVI